MLLRRLYQFVHRRRRQPIPFEAGLPSRSPVFRFGLATLICLLFLTATHASVVNYYYDNAGRLVAVLDANGNGSIYTYDDVGNLTNVQFTNAVLKVFSLSRTY